MLSSQNRISFFCSGKFNGILSAGYNLSYTYVDNSQQIANIADASYRADRSGGAYGTGRQQTDVLNEKAQSFTYDANGNMTYVATGKKLNDSTLQATSTRQLLWDEENRLLAISDNGYVSNYWYDAAGERTVKQSGGSEGVFVNGVLSGARTETGKFTAYISPYMVVSNGGNYSKHIYMGSQRITSKLGSSEIFHDSVNPIAPANPHNLAMAAKLSTQNAMIQNRFDSLGVVYRGISQGSAGLITSIAGRIASPQLYFYHSDHLGSSSLITDNNGTLVQHLEYVPFGEVFLEENRSTWSTPFKFTSKELDAETGLYYFGARYYDPKTSVWLNVDPLAEKYVGWSSYNYCLNNPVKFVDPDGKEPTTIIAVLYALYETGMSVYDAYDMVKTLFFDDNATNFEKAVTTAGFTAGLFSVGGGYGKLAREGALLVIEQTIKRTGNLRAALGVTKANAHLWKGFQAHHLIPVDLLKKNKLVKDAVLAGFDFNGKSNGLLVKAGKGYHSRHDAYTKAIENKINDYLKTNPNYKPEDAREFLEGLAKKASEAIKKNGDSVNNIIKID